MWCPGCDKPPCGEGGSRSETLTVTELLLTRCARGGVVSIAEYDTTTTKRDPIRIKPHEHEL